MHYSSESFDKNQIKYTEVSLRINPKEKSMNLSQVVQTIFLWKKQKTKTKKNNQQKNKDCL